MLTIGPPVKIIRKLGKQEELIAINCVRHDHANTFVQMKNSFWYRTTFKPSPPETDKHRWEYSIQPMEYPLDFPSE